MPVQRETVFQPVQRCPSSTRAEHLDQAPVTLRTGVNRSRQISPQIQRTALRNGRLELTCLLHRSPDMQHFPPEDEPALADTSALVFVRMPAVMRITGLGRSTIYRLIAEQRFPCPVRLGLRAKSWAPFCPAAIRRVGGGAAAGRDGSGRRVLRFVHESDWLARDDTTIRPGRAIAGHQSAAPTQCRSALGRIGRGARRPRPGGGPQRRTRARNTPGAASDRSP